MKLSNNTENLKKRKTGFKEGIVERNLGYILLAPAVITIGIIAIFPILKTFWYSLFDMQLQNITSPRFIGIDNYIKLSQDTTFLQSLRNTVYFSVLSVILELLIGFIAALLMDLKFKGRAFLRATILIPWAIPGIIIALIFQYMFNDRLGIINVMLIKFHLINSPVLWLGTKGYAMWSVIVVDVWKQVPFMALILVAGLQMIPKELYESCDVDGATYLEKLFYITIPQMKPVIMVALLFRTMGAFKVFDTIYGLTGGGPGNSTSSISVYAYKTLFNDLDFGYGSTIAIATFVIIFILCLGYIKLLGTEKED